MSEFQNMKKVYFYPVTQFSKSPGSIVLLSLLVVCIMLYKVGFQVCHNGRNCSFNV